MTGLTLEFKDGVKNFIGWAKEDYNWTSRGKESVQDYFEAAIVPLVPEEQTQLAMLRVIIHIGVMNYIWIGSRGLVFYAAGPSYFSSSDDGVPDNGTSACCKPSIVERLHPQLGVVAKLVDIKVDDHISKRIYDQVSQWANRIFAPNHTLPGDYYSSKELIKDLGLFVEEIDGCENGCMLYWKDNIDSEYFKFCGDARYKPSWGRDPRWKKLPYVFFRNTKAFTKHHVENKVARPRLTGDHILDWVANISSTVEMSFSLPSGHGRDHKWTKKNIFWDFPYWSMLLIRHNLGVMHIEKNVFGNIFNTVMDIKGKTKDNLNTRRDLKIICNRPELKLGERRLNVMPKTVYTLTKEQKRRVCEWIRGLKFHIGYASNLACCVDMTELRMHRMKSYDCHVFMQKLIPIAFRDMLPEHVWSTLPEENQVSRGRERSRTVTPIQGVSKEPLLDGDHGGPNQRPDHTKLDRILNQQGFIPRI
ncbi:UNVERIFIED_CONTAM: hypothetical protein Sangu_2971500 [Sesamum angustifolium]|uniref:Uncharacterized protein n=1 Tax=Sesamum angustifolium TaxID=2727405 RepID=A0AAW2IIW0_9LAMI